MPYQPIIPQQPVNGIAAGMNEASSALQNAGSSISQSLQRIGLLHLQDSQAGAMLNAFKQQGFDKDPAMKALFTAADKGPLGTKTMAFGVIQNYMNMAQQIRMLQAKRGIEGGGFVDPSSVGSPGPGSGSGNGGNGYDLNTPPPNPNSSGIDLSAAQNPNPNDQ